LLYYSI
jgi:RNA polymerase sigma factor (sigma-70 family)